MPEHQDRPRDAIMQFAAETLKQAPAGSYVMFKFTCAQCGERCTFQKKNRLYERGECYKCGHDQPIDKAGFALLLSVAGEESHA